MSEQLQHFQQAAFDYVADVVSSYGKEIVMSGSSSRNTEQCLEQLARVATTWGLDGSRIYTMYELFCEENHRIEDYEQQCREVQ